ncbi:MAG: SAM-dependent methyltransferase [Bacteroidales bacterium]|nr:SAM-dependent methyltransferase [Bacteroidales bacterium]
MRLFDASISNSVFLFLKKDIKTWATVQSANAKLCQACGITNFFSNDTEIQQIANELNGINYSVVCEDRAEYGDFQTNQSLTQQIATQLKREGINPQIVIEPTCGKGNFILSVLDTFENVERIYGIEIQKKYTWQAKFNVLDFFLNNPNKIKPEIQIVNSSIFEFDYQTIKKTIGEKELLIIGNPPWVTNSALGVMDSKNLPKKSNFKQHKGLDAMTGKGNFDIAEYITIDLLQNFGKCKGNMAFLVKNTVIKNIVHDLPKLKLLIAGLKKQNIDSKKEFDVSVDASLFSCQLNKTTELSCLESDFYTSEVKCNFGWLNGKFLSNLSCSCNDIDGVSPFEWRQGIKHDCSKVMEMEFDGDCYSNKLGERFVIEEDLVFPLLKSSDLKKKHAEQTRKMVIVTQKYVGQNTSYIQEFPQTYEYLNRHIDLFRNRKSSIYKGKCDFSIFGVGDYSFKPYKIAISGLYKTFHFCLVKPQNNKPVMLDDTCYFIGFDTLEQAEYVWDLLNSVFVTDFLKSISFKDSKRMITKEVLMRIDLKSVAILKGEKKDMFDCIDNQQEIQLSLF